jgi:hypothetical protein
LKIWIISVDKVKDAIQSGRLKGKTTGGLYGGALIDSPSRDVVHLLKDKRGNNLFVLLGEYEKIAK